MLTIVEAIYYSLDNRLGLQETVTSLKYTYHFPPPPNMSVTFLISRIIYPFPNSERGTL